MVDCCAEKTYASTTIADVVGRAAVSRTTFYKLFDGKRDCFDGAVALCIDRIAAALAAGARDGGSPAEATRRAVISCLELLAAAPELALVLSGDAVGLDPELVDRYGALIAPALVALWDGEKRPPARHLSSGLALGRAQVLIFHEVAAGRAERLPDLAPDIVYLAIAPFAGHDEALRQARPAARVEARA